MPIEGWYCFGCMTPFESESAIENHKCEGVEMSDTAYKISVMQAFEEGKAIESIPIDNLRNKCYVKECCISSSPDWDWKNFNYRVKKEPMVIYCNIYTDGHINTIHKTKKSAETAFRELQKLMVLDNQDRCAVKFQEVIE